jgi:hypothetical protein
MTTTYSIDDFGDDLTADEIEALKECDPSERFESIRHARKAAAEWIAEEERIAYCDGCESNRFGNGWHNNEDI